MSEVLDPDQLPVIIHILDHVRIRDLLASVEKFTDWERFHVLAYELISPRIKINSGEEADKVACELTASVASVCKLATSEITLLDLNNNLPGLDHLLKGKQRLRKLRHKTWDPTCKATVNWVARTIRRMTQRKALK
jgi:hypothetical protein